MFFLDFSMNYYFSFLMIFLSIYDSTFVLYRFLQISLTFEMQPI